MHEGSQKISAIWAQYMATYLTEEEKVLAADFQERRAVFLRDGLEPALAIAAQGDGAGLQKHHEAKLLPLFEDMHSGQQEAGGSSDPCRGGGICPRRERV